VGIKLTDEEIRQAQTTVDMTPVRYIEEAEAKLQEIRRAIADTATSKVVAEIDKRAEWHDGSEEYTMRFQAWEWEKIKREVGL
jgi:hypothetical protein